MFNNYSAKTKQRILHDIKQLKSDYVANDGIFTVVNENDLSEIYVVMTGPKDTPYYSGYYLFSLKILKDYPFKPPEATFYCFDRTIRIHPNYYCCGKCCLSLLGTWSGPEWSACQTLYSLLISMRSLLISNPLWQEPGFEGLTNLANQHYNKIITYHNIETYILTVLFELPKEFLPLQPVLLHLFYQNYPYILAKCYQSLSLDKKTVKMKTPYGITTTLNYNSLINKLQQFYNKLIVNKNRADLFIPLIPKEGISVIKLLLMDNIKESDLLILELDGVVARKNNMIYINY